MISKNTISGLCRFLFPSVCLYVCLSVMYHNSFRLSKPLFSSSPCSLQLCLQTRGLPHQTNRQKQAIFIQTSIYFSVCWFLVTFLRVPHNAWKRLEICAASHSQQQSWTPKTCTGVKWYEHPYAYTWFLILLTLREVITAVGTRIM